ncbi:site-specific integrase (plasmid) [Pseudochrobactrum algeriensis]|uniref:tyrosine-type recombinase/integrase n=1 Tax=Pseudochrobactrum algeriensis TaxID=2834768 RepID=UPI001BCC4A79|nr:site-specific integrase [Pseudochrobactrum algeriensis]QVQ38659.1 site-specific integrase [Pseudochrobactrum algeriensis]QVQ42223.1 site-specific integrase [Pseudochrobactrum algeriensis]QVQ45803.1 site-specific integrase [Pseudochrobactrum algeriensis]
MPQQTKHQADVQIESWITLQRDLGKAPNTVAAYERGVRHFAAFCRMASIDLLHARKGTIAAYLHHLCARPLGGGRTGDADRSLTPSPTMANASLRHRLTIIRLFYDHLVEEGLRDTNPVPRGRRGAIDGTRHQTARGLVPVHRTLPWVPSQDQWTTILKAARTEPIRNRLMLAFAYDCALRREELCALETSDLDPAQRLITIRAETTKTKTGRIVPYSSVTGELLAVYLRERRALSRARGPLFLSNSPRNWAMPISKWTWSKVIRAMGIRAGEPKLGTHTMRHLCLTDLARVGWDIHEIARFAGHRNVQTTLLYIHLSARDLSAKFAATAAELHEARLASIMEVQQ